MKIITNMKAVITILLGMVMMILTSCGMKEQPVKETVKEEQPDEIIEEVIEEETIPVEVELADDVFKDNLEYLIYVLEYFQGNIDQDEVHINAADFDDATKYGILALWASTRYEQYDIVDGYVIIPETEIDAYLKNAFGIAVESKTSQNMGYYEDGNYYLQIGDMGVAEPVAQVIKETYIGNDTYVIEGTWGMYDFLEEDYYGNLRSFSVEAFLNEGSEHGSYEIKSIRMAHVKEDSAEGL